MRNHAPTRRRTPDRSLLCALPTYGGPGQSAPGNRKVTRRVQHHDVGSGACARGKGRRGPAKTETHTWGMNFELLRDCWPDSSTSKCAETAKLSEADFRAIPFTDAWYFGAAMQAFVGKRDAAVRLLQAASEHGLCVYPSVDQDPLFDKIRASMQIQ